MFRRGEASTCSYPLSCEQYVEAFGPFEAKRRSPRFEKNCGLSSSRPKLVHHHVRVFAGSTKPSPVSGFFFFIFKKKIQKYMAVPRNFKNVPLSPIERATGIFF